MNNVVLVDRNGNVLGKLSDFEIHVIPEDILSMGDPGIDGYVATRDDGIPLIPVSDVLEAGSLPGLVFIGG